uniref:Superoxide dismutase copper/zinc binding domain-containing protein n=1 Tax=Sparus aurata TaxID=8175 RepID=A0A671W5F9_SPAAU
MVRVPKASTDGWFGPGMSSGRIQFSQAVPQGPTYINVSLINLDSLAGGYHVHILPLKPGSVEPCSNANILGHFNPLAVNVSNSPAPGTGTVDQYEIGDISGKFGTLNSLNESQAVYMDPDMPLTGPFSVVGRSIVIHYKVCSLMPFQHEQTLFSAPRGSLWHSHRLGPSTEGSCRCRVS